LRTRWSEVNDSDIAREAGEALDRAVDVPGSVKAVVHDHVVTLTGDVDWQFQRSAADRAVRYAKGVTSLLNLVKIRPAVMVSGVKSSITSALVRTARLESRNIRVTTGAEGVVTLHGTVRSWAERREAEQACWAAPGVIEVVNDLHIEY
jgi:osmotically-inducible protein OsmY